jgi:hypothetical protein
VPPGSQRQTFFLLAGRNAGYSRTCRQSDLHFMEQISRESYATQRYYRRFACRESNGFSLLIAERNRQYNQVKPLAGEHRSRLSSGGRAGFVACLLEHRASNFEQVELVADTENSYVLGWHGGFPFAGADSKYAL